MRVGEILHGKSRGALSVGSDQTLRTVIDILAAHRIGLLLVTDEGERFCGVISERDVMRELSKKGAAAFDTKVADVMTKNVITVEPETDSHDALVQMGENAIRHLPVVDQAGLPIGVISATDILKTLSKTGSAEERVALWTKVAWV